METCFGNDPNHCAFAARCAPRAARRYIAGRHGSAELPRMTGGIAISASSENSRVVPVRPAGIEPASLTWQASIQPLNQGRVVRAAGYDPTRAIWKNAMQPLHLARRDRAHVRSRTGWQSIPRIDARLRTRADRGAVENRTRARFLARKGGVPTHSPVAGLLGIEPSSEVLEASLRPSLRPVVLPDGVEPSRSV